MKKEGNVSRKILHPKRLSEIKVPVVKDAFTYKNLIYKPTGFTIFNSDGKKLYEYELVE